jgi:hypothetical protein
LYFSDGEERPSIARSSFGVLEAVRQGAEYQTANKKTSSKCPLSLSTLPAEKGLPAPLFIMPDFEMTKDLDQPINAAQKRVSTINGSLVISPDAAPEPLVFPGTK